MSAVNFNRRLRNIMNYDIYTLKYFLQVVSPSKEKPREARHVRPVTGSVHRSCRLNPRGNAGMSRRKVSVKDLGQGDCSGWLHKKKDGKGFLGTRWKKYWFVLKKNSLYWYATELAEKAEGYINLREFTVEQALEHKKKNAMKASHPQVMTLYFAAESIKDMNKWLSAFKEASMHRSPTPASEDEVNGCYSEASDHEETDSVEVACQPYTEELTASSINDELPPPRCSSSPYHPPAPLSTPSSSSTSPQTSEATATAQSESWLEVSFTGLPALTLPQREEDGPPQQQQQQQHPCTGEDEMEQLYLHLKQARLSPTGHLQPASKRDYRASFIKRCQDEAVNEKLHYVRTLNSTLKSKEADLLCIEQVLADPCLSAYKYREWKEANVLLLQDIAQCSQPPGQCQSTTGAGPAQEPTQTCTPTPYYAETSV
ncbi:interactor protein for cytohesin exchange factors 1 isoform X1 [Alosa alosa]|uniref:interactor protein for cytohesin exchange factors 1 isoform X1 n=2 Tax=Alosa alosa TaxID=278164 RepID=UPI0020151CF0|nr:interactor protein for cytohesin exchange factors 1 isoform X1 [Alosa alosa]